jgi:hypothetical protein
MKPLSHAVVVGNRPLRKGSRPLHFSAYGPVIQLVSGALLAAGMALSAQGQSQADSTTAVPAATGNSGSDLSVPPPSGKDLVSEPKVYKNEVGVTADFLLGEGKVTIPIGYALSKALPGGGLEPQVISGNRSTIYYGGTVSYSYGRSWYLDFSYENGVSTGSQEIQIKNTLPGEFNGDFNYNDDWYQIYIRYNFQNLLAGTRFKAYLRGGVSLVDATLTVKDVSDTPSLYNQHDDTSDILGNLGFGLTYSLYARPRFKVGLQVEGEGFYGARSQQSTETLPADTGLGDTHANIDNDLYGGIARGTLHADWRLGESGRWRLTADVGIQYKYTSITYSGASAPDESLWGPYAKVGVSYVF